MQKLIYVFVLVVFFSCDRTTDPIEVSEAASKNMLFKENVAVIDARARAVDPAHFVKELVLADFSKEGVTGDAFVFEDMAFIDNGQVLDLIAGDGVFTAVEKSPYNDRVRVGSLTGSQSKSLANGVVVDPVFKKSAELADFQTMYFKNSPSMPNARREVLVCVVEWGGGGCRADKWGWCNNCCFTYRCHYEYWD